MRDHRDRATLRKSIADWPRRFQSITPEKRHNWVADLEDVRASALNIVNAEGAPLEAKLKAIAEVRSCAATSAAIDSMDQKQEMALAAARLKDLHHIETLEQADRHHAAGSKVQQTSDVRIIVEDASGATKRVTNLRQFYADYPAVIPEASPGAAGLEQAQGGDGGAPRRENGP
jgi:hypothetical protein